MDERLALFRIGLARSTSIEQRQQARAPGIERRALAAREAAVARTALWKAEQHRLVEESRRRRSLAAYDRGASAPSSTADADGSTPSAPLTSERP